MAKSAVTAWAETFDREIGLASLEMNDSDWSRARFLRDRGLPANYAAARIRLRISRRARGLVVSQ